MFNLDVRVTEVSLSVEVSGTPRVHVGRRMPFLVNTCDRDTERVIPSSEEAPPPWLLDPQPDAMRFVYSCDVQDVECTYSKSRSTLTFHGIKYKNMEKFNAHVGTVFGLLKVEQSGSISTRYKAVAKMDVRAPWDRDVMADVMTNDPDMARVTAVCEKMSTLGCRRMFSAAFCVGPGDETCRVAITHANGQISAMMSKLPDEDASSRAADVLSALVAKYEDRWECPPPEPVTPVRDVVSGIKALRRKLPELFINNYTRECPVLPVMVPSPESASGRVIMYPKEGPHARYYTAPDGYFVGLKRNRLANKAAFSCLVTCYLQDHMERKGSETHTYYNSESQTDSRNRNKPMPRSISDPRYQRKGASSFLDAVESATNTRIDDFPWCPQVLRQEMWDASDEDIMTSVKNGAIEGSRLYRYFEELTEVSIHVVVIKDGNLEPLVPPHVGPYVWAPPYPMHVVVFETHKTTYGSPTCTYEYLTKKDETMFRDDDNVVSYLISQKNAISVPPENLPPVSTQVTDRNGKCCRVILESGEQRCVFTRPMAVPAVPEPPCFFDFHVRKMNAAKLELGLKTLDLSKRSNGDVLYFPNDFSFRHYFALRL